MSTKTSGPGFVKPDATDLVSQSIKDMGANWDRLADLLYPVGCIYMSAVNKPPSFGEWTKIEGRFPLGASSAYPAGSTGGEAKHALTASEMPSHTHSPLLEGQGGSSGGISFSASGASGGYFAGGYIDKAGGGQAHNNMPPYLAVHMWRRTA
ncbi:hypothetical protein [Gordonibacter sp. Marseille-P4307]|uniref:phage baseplate protein n=1 Tax=Gordonibacter sp. Marseille-P4307 TaxID=2161815 RepID=UPI000F53B9B7|nr:hypothetical protein [Gordonibacter sp. Marseille-P4307]